MRFLAIVPVLLSIAALILTFLCLFAGSTPGFMEDYAVVTLNTSTFGAGVVNLTSSSGDDSNIFQNLLNDLTDAISDEINDGINYLARDFGLQDFYSLHVLSFCEGFYEPGPVPNDTLSRGSISQNTTRCSNRTALFEWNPRQQLQEDLDATGHSWLNVSALNWPDRIDDSVDALTATFKATFVMYCIAIAFIFIALLTAIIGIFLVGRIFATVNIIVDVLAFLCVGIASALVTAVMQQGVKQINVYGSDVGVEAYGSSKLLAITWVATALMFVASIIWCVACIVGRRDKGAPRRGWRSRRGPGNDIDMVDVKGHR